LALQTEELFDCIIEDYWALDEDVDGRHLKYRPTMDTLANVLDAR